MGNKVSWIYGGKRYSGTLINSKETKTHRYARTQNGNIKSLPKKKKQKKIAKAAAPYNKITGDDFKALKAMKSGKKR